MSALELDLPSAIPGLLLAGKILSAITLVVVLVALTNVWRRPALPAITYGEIELSQRRMRWVWTGFLLGALALGTAEDPLARQTATMEDAEALEAAGATRQTGLSLPFPFYRYERVRRYADGGLAAEDVTQSVLIPWSLLSALLAYVILVIRWNPANKWALRILQGRKRRWGPGLRRQ